MNINIYDKINEIAEDTSSSWLEDAELRKRDKRWLRRSAYVALKVLDAIKEKGMRKGDLATLMGVKPQQISRIVKGEENLTLETLDKLEEILDIKLLADNKNDSKDLAAQQAVNEISINYEEQKNLFASFDMKLYKRVRAMMNLGFANYIYHDLTTIYFETEETRHTSGIKATNYLGRNPALCILQEPEYPINKLRKSINEGKKDDWEEALLLRS